MPEITATVVAKSQGGVMLEENGPWYNWSLPEYRGEPFNTEVQKGDRVQITYATKEYTDKETGEPLTKYFVSTIDKVTGATLQRHDGAGDEGQGPDEPFPPDEEFPPDDGPGFGGDAPSEPSPAPRREKSTNESIEGQVALKAAIELVIAKGDEPNLEKWVGAVMYAFEVFRDALEP